MSGEDPVFFICCILAYDFAEEISFPFTKKSTDTIKFKSFPDSHKISITDHLIIVNSILTYQ
jgi:hypothetical protein